MAGSTPIAPSERESLKVAEASRQTEWLHPSFILEMFMGRFRLDLAHPFPGVGKPWRPEFKQWFDTFKKFLEEKVDPLEIDATGEYPADVVDEMKKMGAFGLKIAKDYSGLGFTQTEYGEVMKLLGGYDRNIYALLSAHQSIGVPQPLKLFGSEELKKKYLPQCAAGAVSAFALTELAVGSDPSKLSTTAEKTPEGDAYVMNGTKLWCTGGTMADLIVVMASDPKTRKISAFVVETKWPGVEVVYRSRFMGLKALANAMIQFTNVRIPAANLIGGEGRGLKIALTTLNDGRLALPACTSGLAKRTLRGLRVWCNERIQWGKPIGKHEAVGQMLSEIAATTFAMESISLLVNDMVDSHKFDIRLEAAAAKEWNTARGWEICDKAMQVRGGRGYETERSLIGRGDRPMDIERAMRDSRVNLIFEGSSQIMHLFMAREAVDKHLQVAGAMIDPDKPMGAKMAALPKIAAFYAAWYPTTLAGFWRWGAYGKYGSLARHLRFIESHSRKLARQIFHGMLVHRAGLQNKQGFLFRVVDIGMELFAMTATVSRAQTMRDLNQPNAAEAADLADLFCRMARRKITQLFRDLWRNEDNAKAAATADIMKGRHEWMEAGVMELAGAGRGLGMEKSATAG